MGAFYTPNLPYDLNAWLDNLGPYSLSEEAATFLDNAREIIASGLYYFMGVAFPGAKDAILDAGETFGGNIVIPSKAYLLLVTGDSVDGVIDDRTQTLGFPSPGTNQGFKLRIYDKGGKIDTVINSQFGTGFFPPMTNDTTLDDPSLSPNVPIGPYLLQSPMVILEPGSIQLEITNLSNTKAWCQVLLSLAIPLSRLSTNEMLVGAPRKN